MYDSWTENVVLWSLFETYTRFNVSQLLSLSAKSTFKIIHSKSYVFRIDFLKLLNNDDKT